MWEPYWPKNRPIIEKWEDGILSTICMYCLPPSFARTALIIILCRVSKMRFLAFGKGGHLSYFFCASFKGLTSSNWPTMEEMNYYFFSCSWNVQLLPCSYLLKAHMDTQCSSFHDPQSFSCITSFVLWFRQASHLVISHPVILRWSTSCTRSLLLWKYSTPWDFVKKLLTT